MSASCKDTVYVPCPVEVEREVSGGNNVQGNPFGEYTGMFACGKDIECLVTRYHDDPPQSYIVENCEDDHELNGKQQDAVLDQAEKQALDLPFIPYSDR